MLVAFTLSGCSWQASIGGPGPMIIPAPPPGEKIVATPVGGIVEEPDTPPIEVVERGLAQAQTVRSMVRSLSR